jgi:SAM-dependent methyltransferase
VRDAAAYFGDYYRFQIDRIVYPLFEGLDAAMRGQPTKSLYEIVEDRPDEAEAFTLAQHSGSLGPAYVLSKQIDLSGWRSLLDVAGGSGAFSITFCRRNPELQATILDFPNVIEIARKFVAEAGLETRIRFLAGNALETQWPEQQDAVLMSYLLSGVAEKHIKELISNAYQALQPGGKLLIHDFMVEDDRSGPTGASLWFLSFVFEPQAVSFSPRQLNQLAQEVGFSNIEVQDAIPGITKLLVATKSVNTTPNRNQ